MKFGRKSINNNLCGILILVGILAVVAFLASPYALRVPFKVTDPDSADFSKSMFRFEDYGSPQKISEALHAILPTGTAITDVESFLLNVGGVTKAEEVLYLEASNQYLENYKETHVYYYKPENVWTRLPFVVRSLIFFTTREEYKIIADIDQDDRLLVLIVKY